MSKYSHNTVITIISPHPYDGSQVGELKKDSKITKISTLDLFDNYLHYTVDTVVQSSQQFSGDGNTDARFEEDLDWSLVYFEKNTDPALYAQVYGDMLTHQNKKSHDGPLIFKLIENETSTKTKPKEPYIIAMGKPTKLKQL